MVFLRNSFIRHLICMSVLLFASSIAVKAQSPIFMAEKHRMDSIAKIIESSCERDIQLGLFHAYDGYRRKGADKSKEPCVLFKLKTLNGLVFQETNCGYRYYSVAGKSPTSPEPKTGVIQEMEYGTYYLLVIKPSGERTCYFLQQDISPHNLLTKDWPYSLNEYGYPFYARYYKDAQTEQPLDGVNIELNGSKQWVFKVDNNTYITEDNKTVNLSGDLLNSWNRTYNEAQILLQKEKEAYLASAKANKPTTVSSSQISTRPPEEIPSKEEVLARHKEMVSSLGATPTSTTTIRETNYDKPVNALHFPGNKRLYRTDAGECLIPEPTVTSRLKGTEEPQLNAVALNGEPSSMTFNLTGKAGTIQVVSQDGELYLYYPSGAVLKIARANNRGDVLFRTMVNLNGHPKSPFKFEPENLRKFSQENSPMYYKNGDQMLTVIKYDKTKSYGWNWEDPLHLIFAKDSNNKLYNIDPESGLATKVGVVVGDVIIRVPEGLEFKEFANPRVNFTNGSYMTYQDYNDGTKGVDYRNFMLKFDNMIFESTGKGFEQTKLIYERNGQELEARGQINIPWEKQENPQTLIDYANVYDAAGNDVYVVNKGRDSNEIKAEAAAKEKELEATLKKKVALVKQKYGVTYANKALAGQLVAGMPINLVKDLDELYTLKLESQTTSTSWYYVYKKNFTSVGSFSLKYAYISVRNGKIASITYTK